MPRTFWILLLVGVLLRVAFIEARPAGALVRGPDEDEYLELARNLAHGHGYQMHGEISGYRDMLWPFTASLVMRLTGDSPKGPLYLQLIISCLTGWLLYVIGRRRFTEKAALLMVGIWFLYPGAALPCALFLTETLCVFWWVLAVALYDRLEENGYRLSDALPLGIVLGFVALSRAVGIVLLAAVLLYILLIRIETPWRERAKTAGLIFLAAFVTLLPWMVRNQHAVGKFTLNTNGGINLLIGNNSKATGSYYFTPEVEGLLPPAEAGEVARDDAGSALARRFMEDHPREALSLWPRKFAYFWATDMALWIHYYPPDGPPSTAARLRERSAASLALLALPYMLILLCGTAGFYLVRQFPSRGFFLLQLAFGTLPILMSYGLPRYHLPLMPALVVGCGALWRDQVWIHAPLWRRFFLLWVLGMFLGIWLLESLRIAGL
jgi:4-amino-4-deoxy-L-arabinose transferase-like glycosyltransferase